MGLLHFNDFINEADIKIPKYTKLDFDKFNKKYNPINIIIFPETHFSKKAARVDLIVNKELTGQGIISDEFLTKIQVLYKNDNVKEIIPSLGIWTKDGLLFMNKLVNKGYFKNINNYKFLIMDNILEYASQNLFKKWYNDKYNN